MAEFTPNYRLHQWEPTDDFLRTDFNQDFSAIDAALAGLENNKLSRDEFQAGAQITLGSYTGNGMLPRTISLGVTPKVLLLFDSNGRTGDGWGGMLTPTCPIQTSYVDNNKNMAELRGNNLVLNSESSNYMNQSGRSYYYLILR